MPMSETLSKVLSPAKRILGVPAFIIYIGTSILRWPYRFFYDENTRDPIIAIVSGQDETTIQFEVNRWLKVKLKEARYVETTVSLPLVPVTAS